jgi:hypothetical protein
VQQQNNDVLKRVQVVDTPELDCACAHGDYAQMCMSTIVMVTLKTLSSLNQSLGLFEGLVVSTTNPPTSDLPHNMP